jgi:dTDP-4-dehydrorhamnose 3,5-epimerase
MHFQPLGIQGVVQVDVEAAADVRGSFARLHCEREFEAHGLSQRMVQSSVSHSQQRGTLRGMHFQWPPSREAKLVRCIRGAILDVVIDLRPDSPTYTRHLSLELMAAGRRAVFIPPGLAHGFQTLEDEVEVLYQMTDFYEPALAAGVRWNDPAFAIAWPLPVTTIHERDAAYADFDAVRFADEYGARSSRSD